MQTWLPPCVAFRVVDYKGVMTVERVRALAAIPDELQGAFVPSAYWEACDLLQGALADLGARFEPDTWEGVISEEAGAFECVAWQMKKSPANRG